MISKSFLLESVSDLFALCASLSVLFGLYKYLHEFRDLFVDVIYYCVSIFILWHLHCIISQQLIKVWSPKVDPKNKAIFITGCDTGFGHSFAKRLSSIGFHVFAGCLNPSCKGADKLSLLKNITVVELDVTKETSVNGCYDVVQEQLSKRGLTLHGVVNNAGVAEGTGIELSNFEHFNKTFSVNIQGYALVAKTFIPLLRKNEGSRLINIGSISSQSGFVFAGGYSASKVLQVAI